MSFKTNEAKLKEFFEKFGPVLEVKLLKKPDGKLVGCGFIQYEVTQNAARAIYETSGKPFLGRDIVCDWALGKDTYVRNMQEAKKAEIKKEADEVIEIKEEPVEDVKTQIEKVKTESDSDGGSNDSDSDDSKSGKHDSDDEDSESDVVEDEEDIEDEEMEDDQSQYSQEPEIKKPRVISNDVQEGKTIFIKNVPFSATNNDVKQCMEKFGPLHYALVCMDRLTEHSKGTAFVKFQNLEDAEKCLEAGTELTLMGQILDCHRAVSKTDIDNKQKKEVKKDSRNLYLIKEGVILAGSRAAQSVSAADMAKRLELEKWKTQILRNLNMFISRNRLIIHNLPASYGDKELRELFEKFSGPSAVIKEARVMKDLRNLDESGKPISKEHGFVTFVEHEDAIKALRAVNNNPSIFTRAKRPIVAFSIENKSVINARNKRLIKSKLNNPLSKEFNPKAPAGNMNKSLKQQNKQVKHAKFRARDNSQVESEYTGVTSKPGRVDKMRSKHKLTTQARIHHETLKNEKKKIKLTRRVLKKKKDDYLKQAKQKKGKGKKKPKEDNFTKLVDKYTSSTVKGSKVKKRKWFET